MLFKNENNSNNTSYGGISTLGLLGCIFITLKLLKVINWTWWGVLLPFYGPIVLIISIAVISFIVLLFKR